jgi:CMP-N,N'-diacetyllegionaminic acid synthase
MRILALIPARGGSKRLPGKNLKLLGGKPLINWSIESVSGIPQICDILVSTDDVTIAAVAREAGAFVPWLRPEELASDDATSIDVALHALNWYESNRGSVDGLLLLQPTSPFRSRETILKGIKLFEEFAHEPVVSVSTSQSHPMWTFKQEGNFIVPFMDQHKLNTRSQELPSAYSPNGVLYLASPLHLRNERSFVGLSSIPQYISSLKEAIDIDSGIDFEFAVHMLDKDL